VSTTASLTFETMTKVWKRRGSAPLLVAVLPSLSRAMSASADPVVTMARQRGESFADAVGPLVKVT
jgi:hypothetical protein